MLANYIHLKGFFCLLDWSSLGGQLSENLRSLPKPTPRTPTMQNPLRILISRSHSMGDFSEKLRKAFGSTPIEIIAAGGSGIWSLPFSINWDLFRKNEFFFLVLPYLVEQWKSILLRCILTKTMVEFREVAINLYSISYRFCTS